MSDKNEIKPNTNELATAKEFVESWLCGWNRIGLNFPDANQVTQALAALLSERAKGARKIGQYDLD